MLVGAHLAGCAIENAMLGAAHACANPLTARYNIVHGHAVGIMLPHVVRFNSANGQRPYTDLAEDPQSLAAQLTRLLAAAEIPATLREHGVKESSLPDMAEMAATQWTATFNPRKVGVSELRALYESAM
jgi:alcohol dehydrogenase